jgi:hypothetical protein
MNEFINSAGIGVPLSHTHQQYFVKRPKIHYASAKETLKYVKKRREICQKGTENMRDVKSVVKSVVKNVVSARILLTRSERVWLSHFTTPSLLLLLYY